MKTEICAELKGNGKQQPVFEGLKVQAELRETLSLTTITQSYRNSGTKNIEAVYTFPLPLDAVLLDMTVTLGNKTLKGTVLPKQEAEEQYEDAITDGDAPVMLQNPQPGTYTMNVGNLLPGEKATITIRYGIFMRWQGDTMRYHLSTTIAPRYGSALKAGLESQQEPETSLLAENLFAFEMKIIGRLSGMVIESPSHALAVERTAEGNGSEITLEQKTGFMDRDLIVTIRKQAQQPASVVMAQDGDEYLLWGSFQPQFDLKEDPAPRSVKIVVDCSGSMAGDSIAQARAALLRILDELRPQDWFNIVAFGSTATPLFNAQTKADQESISYARGFLKNLDAEMGGTEIGSALELAVRLRCPDKIQQDVLLITDGEIWEWERVVEKARKSKHRFFTVGVGSSVSEAFVKTLAEQTGGACELVSPNEKMAERIHRHFKRLSSPGSGNAAMGWPDIPIRSFPEKLPVIYNNDTCNLFAWFSAHPTGEAQLKLPLSDGTACVMTATTTEDNWMNEDLPRMAAALKLREIDDEIAGQELAVKYQLISRFTNYLAIMSREDGEKPDNLPELHKVQQMLAAGWAGTGSVQHTTRNCIKASFDASPMFMRGSPAASPPQKVSDVRDFIMVREETFFSPNDDPCPPEWIWEEDQDKLDQFIGLLDQILATGLVPTTICLPLLPATVETILRELMHEGIDEQTVVTLFLHYLAESETGEGLSRQSKRVIQKAYKALKACDDVKDRVKNRLWADGSMVLDDDDSFDTPTFLRREPRSSLQP
jgi:Ca-activated chloride channel homolog